MSTVAEANDTRTEKGKPQDQRELAARVASVGSDKNLPLKAYLSGVGFLATPTEGGTSAVCCASLTLLSARVVRLLTDDRRMQET